MKNILVTGNPGIGKTTLVQKIADEIQGKVGGFYTRERQERGRRTGFEIVTLSGKTGVLADVNLPGRYRVGKYGVNLKDLEDLAIPEIYETLEKGGLVIIDEIGKMELFSGEFKNAVLTALDSKEPVLATIAKHHNPFTDKIKKRDDVKILNMTEANRDSLKSEILNLIEGQS